MGVDPHLNPPTSAGEEVDNPAIFAGIVRVSFARDTTKG